MESSVTSFKSSLRNTLTDPYISYTLGMVTLEFLEYLLRRTRAGRPLLKIGAIVQKNLRVLVHSQCAKLAGSPCRIFVAKIHKEQTGTDLRGGKLWCSNCLAPSAKRMSDLVAVNFQLTRADLTGNSRRIIELNVIPNGHLRSTLLSVMPPKTLTLKQRLAALTQSPTSPTPQYGAEPSPRSPSSKRRFNAPWSRRGSIPDGYDIQSEEDKLQEVMGRMIYQAGVDYECVCSRFSHLGCSLTWSGIWVWGRTRPM